MKKPLIVVVGPTAVGKTDISIDIAKSLDGEIISADSMQIYKYMDIGTAKPTVEEMQGVPHHLIDFVDPGQEFSVAQFQELAKNKIADIFKRDKQPIVVGGSGLYVNSIVFPMNFTEATEDPDFRQKMKQLAEKRGKGYLHSLLQNIDPITAERLHPNDLRRIIRALEIHHMTGKTMAEYKQELNEETLPYKPVIIGLTMDRQKLYQRINKRVDIMLERGLVEEVRRLIEMGYTRNQVSMQGLGYKEIIDYLEGKTTLDEAVEILKRNTRRFAKRQFTWFRRDKRIHWIDVGSFSAKTELLDYILSYLRHRLAGQ